MWRELAITPITVSALNEQVKYKLETELDGIWLSGEVSNVITPASGHTYFTLKEGQKAQVRCVFFRYQQQLSPQKPENGLEVVVKAQVSLYTARGDFQLIIHHLEASGSGQLERAYQQEKQRLHALGWFDVGHKKSLPAYPLNVGVITSATGAAIRDILTALWRRFPLARVILYPCAVQGKKAAPEIVAALAAAERRQECDVLIVARGGGSLEDLWAFNERPVVEAIFHCTLPIVTGIGHEIDETLSDYVADLRAATPTAAAEVISPDQSQLQQQLQEQLSHLQHRLSKTLFFWRTQLQNLQRRLVHPRKKLQQQQQQVDHLEWRLKQVWQRGAERWQRRLLNAQHRLATHSPQQRISAGLQRHQFLQQRLMRTMQHRLTEWRFRLVTEEQRLTAISPMATLKRGYAIVQTETQTVLTSVQQVAPATPLTVTLADGQLRTRVIDIQETEHV